MFAWTLLLTLCALQPVTLGFKRTNIKFNKNTGGYQDIVVVISEELSSASCPQILDNVKASLTEASRALHEALAGEAYLDQVTIEVPHSWTEMDCKTTLSPACLSPSARKTGDILVGGDHPVHGSFPWTQQSLGCGHPGEFVYLPYSFLAPSNSSQLGKMISNQWMRLRYGVFEDFDPRMSSVSVSSRHHAFCRGNSVKSVVMSHEDFQSLDAAKATNFTIPRFTVTRQAAPKYVIVLENSQMMNMRDHWDFIRTTCKKFIMHDLPDLAHVGLVLFNDDAHEAFPISVLGPRTSPQTRDGLAFSIKNKYNLSPSSGSCVRCGIIKAIESLQVSGSPYGGVLIVISRGGITSLSLSEEQEMADLAHKHNLQIFPVSILQPPVTDISLSLERLAHVTGGESFFLVDEAEAAADKSSLSTYVGLGDTFREIQQRTLGNSPSLIYEQEYHPHQEGVYSERGHFIIDKYAGGAATEFNVFALKPYNNFLKSMELQDKRGNTFSSMMDSMAGFHIFSIYNVPYQSEKNIGMNWTYSLERLPATDSSNQHTVQVVSGPRDAAEQLAVRLWTNLEHYAVEVSQHTPVILYAEVKLGAAPVVEAAVTAEILAINQSGFVSALHRVPLLDGGNGDPDLRAQDGIYSRYLTQFPGGEGRYTVNIRVTDNYGKAFAPMKTYGDTRSCCQDKAFMKISNQKLGSFSRIVKGDSFRLHAISPGSLPPSRVMNLAVDVLTDSRQLEFSWTSPGEDFDAGKPTSYQLFYSDQPASFYSRHRARAELVESFSASKSAGSRESKKISVAQFDKQLHYALLAVDSEGNLGEMSNVVAAYMPSPVIAEDAIKTSPHSSGRSVSGEALPSDKPSKILLYLIVGIVGFIILCMMIVMIILLSFRRKKLPEDVSVESNKSNGTSTDNNGFSVTSDDMENMGRDQEAKHFLLGSSAQDSSLGAAAGPTHSSLIQDHSGSLVLDNPYGTYGGHARTYGGWSASASATATSNPYVYKDSNETYASIASFHNSSADSYIRGAYQPQPTYAQPIPKNLRPQHIYSNAAVIARHSPQVSCAASPGQTSADGSSRGTVTFQSAASETQQILRVSPDSGSGSEAAATPTKSILKKPKHHNVADCSGLDLTSDRESQSSQTSSCHGKEDARSPSATDTVSSQHSQVSTITTNEEINLSIEKTYLETSFEFAPLNSAQHLTKEEAENAANAASKKLPPPTLPKPRALNNQDIILSSDNLSNSLDKKIRNCTQV